MCLTVSNTFKSRYEAVKASKHPLIAEKDIIVYKGLKRIKNSNKTRWISPHRRFEFEKGYHYYQDDNTFGFAFKKTWPENTYQIKITQGLHACLIKRRAENHSKHVKKMIVPKGAKYFLNKLGDIVSTELIWRN